MTDNNSFDAIVAGGSYAGLSAAMALGRSLRKVLVIDSGLPCNRYAPHSHNFITHDGDEPHAISRKARSEVLKYSTVRFIEDLAVKAERQEGGFEIATRTGGNFRAKKLILATGIKDTLPDIKGFAECWGVSVVHCPYCHGYELRGHKTAIIGNGDRAVHLASLVRNLTADITLITVGTAHFRPEQTANLLKHNIRIRETGISEIENVKGHVSGVIFDNGGREAFEAIYAALPFTQHSDIPRTLGCALTEDGYIQVDGFQKTTVEGVFACGDNAGMVRSIAHAVHSGNLTGAVVNRELCEE